MTEYRIVDGATLDDTPLARKLALAEERIKTNESDSLTARWEFGHELLIRREGKKLPKGLLAQVCAKYDLGRTEVSQRVQFAETFPTKKELSAAADNYRTWNRIKREALPKPATKPRPAKPPSQLDVRRLSRTITKLDRGDIEANDPKFYTDLDKLYDALLTFFNGPQKKAAQ